MTYHPKFVQITVSIAVNESIDAEELYALDEDGMVWRYQWPVVPVPVGGVDKAGWHALLTSRYDGGVKL